MPPKKPSSVAKKEVASKQKQVEDKTFGLKNKNKSSKVQKYVQHLKQGVEQVKKQSGLGENKDAKVCTETSLFLHPLRLSDNIFFLSQKKKEAEAAREKELNEIFRVAIQQPKVPVG
jgi:hypothetical protein